MKYVRPNLVWSQILNAAVRRCDGQTDTIKWSGPCNLVYFITKFGIKKMSISEHTDVREKKFLNLLRRKKYFRDGNYSKAWLGCTLSRVRSLVMNIQD